MKLLYFHQHFSTPEGAAGTRSFELARRAVAAGHEVTVVCGSYGSGKTGLTGPFVRNRRRGTVAGIEVIEFDLSYSNADGFATRSKTFLRYALQAVRIAVTERYEICFATTTPLTAGLPGIAAKLLRGKTFVFEVRDLWPELPKAIGAITNPVVLWLLSVLEFASYRCADRLVALSPGIAQGIARRGVPEDRIDIVPNGCDLELFSPGGPAPALSGFDEGRLHAVFSGTHGQANGLAAVLDGAAELKRRSRNDIAIHLVGSGKAKPELQARAEAEGLDNVVFHDPVPKTQLAAMLGRADVGIQCLANVPAFYYGTSPNKFFDYIAAGLPVLNNYPGWLAGMIDEMDCGFAVPPDDPAAFADALEAAAEDRQALAQMGGRSRELAEARFDRDALAQRWLAWVVSGKKS